MTTAPAFWRGLQESPSSLTKVFQRPAEINWTRAFLMFALGLIVFASILAPAAATAQNLGTSRDG